MSQDFDLFLIRPFFNFCVECADNKNHIQPYCVNYEKEKTKLLGEFLIIVMFVNCVKLFVDAFQFLSHLKMITMTFDCFYVLRTNLESWSTSRTCNMNICDKMRTTLPNYAMII